jgi:regulator of protease activity HflC (stomatin/prohibitin superfamily)
MDAVAAVGVGIFVWFVLRCIVSGFYTVDQNERAVKTIFGRAERIEGKTTLDDPIAQTLREEERKRYAWPQVRVIPAGGPYFKWPWEDIHKVSVATQTINIAFDPETPSANRQGTVLDAVTKDQLNIGLKGQLRYGVSERNLYAYIWGVKNPIAHIMGYFISILRDRIANFEAPNIDPVAAAAAPVQGISINDLRKNLSELNRRMEKECASSSSRYGILLDAALITSIDPPNEVESALAAINTAHNQVSSEISLAQASADQKIVQSRKAVEIQTLRAQAEVQLLEQMAGQLQTLKQQGDQTLKLYVRNVRLTLFNHARRIFLGVKS